MVLVYAFRVIGFTWIYLTGESKAAFLMQGLRFALAVAHLMAIPGYLIYFAAQPISALLFLPPIVLSTVGVLMMGVGRGDQ